MKKCKCGEPAEVKWTVNGPETVKQQHFLCPNCMSEIWSTINTKFNGSHAQQTSTFEEIRQ